MSAEEQRSDAERFIAFGVFLGRESGNRVVDAVLNALFTYDPVKEQFQARAEFVSAEVIRTIVKETT